MMTRRFLTLLTIALIATLAACGGNDESATTEQAAASADPPGTDRYTVQGEVAKLPAETGDTSLYIRHAAIPDYKNENGEVVGMSTMTMPFPVAEGVSIEGLDPGDPVEFTFTMRWKPQGHYEIVEITELPAGTEIDFDAGGDAGGHEHPHN
jgi:Cu/Ag efflux protein CusF